MNFIKPEAVFSIWIYIWSFLYILFPNYIVYNPLFSLYIASIVSLLFFIKLVYYSNYKSAFLLSLVTIHIKIIPMIIIIKYYNSCIKFSDIYAFALLFLIFLIINYILKNNTPYGKKVLGADYYKRKVPISPLMYGLNKILFKS